MYPASIAHAASDQDEVHRGGSGAVCTARLRVDDGGVGTAVAALSMTKKSARTQGAAPARYVARCAVLAVVALLGPGVTAAGDLATLHRLLAQQSGAVGPKMPPTAAPGDLPPGVMPIAPLPAARPVPDIARLGLERTDCLTRCPAYTVVFSSDGSFTYTGEANVERLGEHGGSVSRGALNQVFRFVAAIDYLGLADSYDAGFLDNPATYTLVEWGAKTKVVLNAGNAAPVTVWALEQLIDDLLDSATWE